MKKLRCDCKHRSLCGVTSRYRCRNRALPECATCTLVRKYSIFKMVDMKLMKVCVRCGKPKPLTAFYPKTVNIRGKTYHYNENICKMCRSERRYEKLAKARDAPMAMQN